MGDVKATAWGSFDQWADRLVKKEVNFETFARNVKADVSRMAWAATRRRRPPFWMGIEDVEGLILQYVWYYAFEHRTRDGKVGFDPSRGSSAGSYLRWNAAQHVQKDIGKARGENMHSHRLTGPAPEAVTKTGEIELHVPAGGYGSEEETIFDRGRKHGALLHIETVVKDFIVQTEIAKALAGKTTAARERGLIFVRERATTMLLALPVEVRAALGLRNRSDAAKFWDVYVESGMVRTTVSRGAVLEEKDSFFDDVLANLPRMVIEEEPQLEEEPEAQSEPEPPVASVVESRHSKDDAIVCEDRILAESVKAQRAKPKQYRPTRASMISNHGTQWSARLGCRCPECRAAMRSHWAAWEARKLMKEKEAA